MSFLKYLPWEYLQSSDTSWSCSKRTEALCDTRSTRSKCGCRSPHVKRSCSLCMLLNHPQTSTLACGLISSTTIVHTRGTANNCYTGRKVLPVPSVSALDGCSAGCPGITDAIRQSSSMRCHWIKLRGRRPRGTSFSLSVNVMTLLQGSSTHRATNKVQPGCSGSGCGVFDKGGHDYCVSASK